MKSEDFLKTIIKGLVRNNDAVSIERIVDNMGVLLLVSVAKEDMGLLIGREGATIKAVRLLLKSYGYKVQEKVSVKVAEPIL